MATAVTRPSIHVYGINYWPETTGIAPYTTGLARSLSARGWAVTVHAGMPHYPQWQISPEYRHLRQIVEQDGSVEVRRYRHFVPSTQSALRRARYEATFLLNGRRVTNTERPSVVLGITPSLSGGVLAQLAARRFGVPYGLLVQDLMGNAADQSGARGGGRVSGLIRRIEGRVARGAAGVAVVADGFRPSLERLGVSPERITTLRNWSHVAPPAGDRAVTRAELGWSDDVLTVLHAGNMGAKQGLEHVIAAARVAEWRGLPIHFVLMGDGSQRAHLELLGSGLRTVSFLPSQPAERFMDVLAAADVLLVNERASVIDMSLPSKLTSYFMAGRPVVAATNPAGTTAREVASSGAGLTVDAEAPDALLDALLDLHNHPERATAMGAEGPRYAASHLSPQAAADRIEAFVNGLLVRPLDRQMASVPVIDAAPTPIGHAVLPPDILPDRAAFHVTDRKP